MTETKLQKNRNGLASMTKGDSPDIRRVPVRFWAHDLFVEVTRERTIEHILRVVATDHALKIEDLYVVRDGEDARLACDEPIHDEHQRRHHVHHRHPVTVTVNYQAASQQRKFRRHAKLEAVLDWAIRVFGIDASMAGEFELTRTGSTEELPLSDHIGHIAAKRDELALDLVRGDIANGGLHD